MDLYFSISHSLLASQPQYGEQQNAKRIQGISGRGGMTMFHSSEQPRHFKYLFPALVT